MDMSYQVPDYGGSLSPAQSSKKQKMRTTYPQLELKGDAAIKFLKQFSNIKLGEDMELCLNVTICGMKRAEKISKSGGDTVSEYDNCVTMDIKQIQSDDEEDTMDDSDMPKE